MTTTTVTFGLKGQMKSGKNRVIVTRSGQRVPPPEFVRWRADMLRQIKAHRLGGLCPMVGTLAIEIEYVPGDRIRRDAPGIQDALFHVLERAGIVADDAQFEEVRYVKRVLDRSNPRANITISTTTAAIANL